MADSNHDVAHRAELLHWLNDCLTRYLRDGDPACVLSERAAERARALVALVGNSAADLQVQVTVGHLYWSRFDIGRRSGGVVDPDERRRAVAHLRPVHERAPSTVPPELAAALDELAALEARAADLIDQAERLRGPAALDEAIILLRRVVATVGDEDPTLPVPLTELAVALEYRYTRRQHAEDLDAAISTIELAVRRTQPADPDRLARQNLYKLCLAGRYDRDRDVADLDRAIELAHELLDRAPAGSLDRAKMLIDAMSLYGKRYDRTQAMADLDAAIRDGRDGLAVLTDPPQRALRASAGDDLAVLLRYRGERTASTDDLEEAVRLHRQAVREFPADHFDRVGMLSGLGESLRVLGSLRRDEALLREAADVAGRVVGEAKRWQHPALAGFEHNAGLAAMAGYRLRPDEADLATAIEMFRGALANAGAGARHHPGTRSELGNALLARAERTGDPELLDEAVAMHRLAVAGALPTGPAAAQVRHNLARALSRRFASSGAAADHDEAVAVFRSIAGDPAGSTRLRLRAARSWGECAATAEDWASASDGFGLAVELLPRLVAPNLARADQERSLVGESGLVADAVAAAVRNGQVERAAVLFEQGRGVLAGHALDLRTDLGRLQRREPRLATEFARLRDALDSERADPQHRDPDERHRWAAEWDALLTGIRALDGFADFLLPMSAARLRAAASPGPIVMVNVSGYRSDALIVRQGGIDVVPLPGLTRSSMEQNWLRFVTALDMLADAARLPRDSVGKANERTRAALDWLWHTVTGPVLDHLGITGPAAGGRRSRMWWMPSTLLNFLPLHAAEARDAGRPGASALERVISSYTPTVRALEHARNRAGRGPGEAGPLVVAMPRTPGQSDLPGARAEARFIAEEFAGTVSLIGAAATRAAVLQRLPAHPWVHLCCHGRYGRMNPSKSHLLVAGGEPLSVLDVVRAEVSGELAYLSACSTRTPGLALVDEAVHLAGAFQLAGYAHVIATMWPIRDDVALEVARRVYSLVTPGSSSVHQLAAILHDAVRRIRADAPEEPMAWAGFVHSGP